MLHLPRIWMCFCLITGVLGNPYVRDEMKDVDPRWPRGLVFYAFSVTLPPTIGYQVRNAMREFNLKTCVNFEDRSTQNDYITIQMGPECWSPIGRLGGEQILNISVACSDKISIIQLLMHAIGFHHEHCRYDRDDYVAIQWKNIRKGCADEFLKLDMDLTDVEEYDFESVMHFSAFMYSTRPDLPTLVPKVEGITLGKNVGFSSGDIVKIDRYYDHCVDADFTTVKPTTSKPEDICQTPNGYYSNPANCSSFYQCENGRPILQQCPAELQFNEDLSVCDWPYNVNCNAN